MTPEQVRCDRCGVASPGHSAAGLCANCMLVLALAPPDGDALSASEATDVSAAGLNLRVGDYEILDEIARGGMGVVYRARQVSLRRIVALKMVLGGVVSSPAMRARFRMEAEAVARLDHPHIVPIYEIGEHEGQPYFSMRHLDGGSLNDVRKRTNPGVRTVVEWLVAVAQAVHHAHQRGVLHRDLKPGNILFDGAGQLHVVDFGLAKVLEHDGDLTHSAAILGTPSYLAPEQAIGQTKQATVATDVYSLGAVLYDLLTGKPPFQGATAAEILRQVIERDPEPPSHLRPGLDRDLDTVCLKCLEKEPARRYGSAESLADDLRRWLDHEPVLARPTSRVERTARWIRRHPAVSALGAVSGLLFLAVTIGSPIAAYRIDQERRRAETNASAEHRQRRVAEAALNRLELERARSLSANGDVASALAHLARLVRQDPSNHVAAEQLISNLVGRDLPLPAGDPLTHTDSVVSAEFSPDGLRILTASKDGTVQIWDAVTGAKSGEPLRHAGPVQVARFSPDGRQVLTVSSNLVSLWDNPAGASAARQLVHPDEVRDAMYSPDGGQIVTVAARTVRLFDGRTGQARPVRIELGGIGWSVEFSPDGRSLVTASDNVARQWDTATGAEVGLPRRHGDLVWLARFSPDGGRILSGSSDSTARIWLAGSVATGAVVFRHDAKIVDAQFSPDGERVVTASIDGTARIWAAHTGRALAGPLRHKNELLSAAFSPDGLRVLTLGLDRIVRIWDAHSGEPIGEPIAHDKRPRSARFSPDGQRVLTACGDRALLWDVRPGAAIPWTFQSRRAVTAAAFDPDGRRVVIASEDHVARLYDAATGRPSRPSLRHGASVGAAVFSADGSRVATASADRTARVWDVATGQPVTPPLGHGQSVATVDFSPDGRLVVTAAADGSARVWDAGSGRAVTDLLLHGSRVESARFSPDGRRVVTASQDSTARVWDARTGQPLTRPLNHDGPVIEARFSPDGLTVVSVGWDRAVRLWESATGRLLVAAPGHEAEVESVQFRADGRALLTASGDRTARVWSMESGHPPVATLVHPAPVKTGRFSVDGRRIVTACFDGAARVWDGSTGQLLVELMRRGGALTSAEFSSDGQRIVTASPDGTARLWEWPQAELPVPAWVPELAEAIARKRLRPDGTFAFVPDDAISRVRASFEFTGDPAAEFHRRWARWLLADRRTRPISPWFPASLASFLTQRLERSPVDDRAGLLESVCLDPANGLAYARLARWYRLQDEENVRAWLGQAESLSRLAVRLAPDSAEVARIRADVLASLKARFPAAPRPDPAALDAKAAPGLPAK